MTDPVSATHPVERMSVDELLEHVKDPHVCTDVLHRRLAVELMRMRSDVEVAVARAEGAEVAWTDTITERDEALAPIRELHRLDKELSCGDGCCDTCECGHPWPCDTALLIYTSEELNQ